MFNVTFKANERINNFRLIAVIYVNKMSCALFELILINAPVDNLSRLRKRHTKTYIYIYILKRLNNDLDFGCIVTRLHAHWYPSITAIKLDAKIQNIKYFNPALCNLSLNWLLSFAFPPLLVWQTVSAVSDGMYAPPLSQWLVWGKAQSNNKTH